MSTLEAYQLIAEERIRQKEIWGEAELNNSPQIWLAILTEELGEVAKEVLEMTFSYGNKEKYREELVQVAAVALAAIESLNKDEES